MEIGSSKIDYTIDKQYFDGRRNQLENRVAEIKQKLRTLEEEGGSNPLLTNMVAQVTGLGSRLDIAI